MKTLKIVFPLVILFIITACGSTPATKFSKSGVSFTCPEGWSITEQEAEPDDGYYLSMERAGLDESGLVAITWVKDSFDLDLWLDSYISELTSNVVYSNAGVQLQDAIETTYNGIPAKAQSFTCSILTVKHRATIYAFHGKNKTICLMKQEADEDAEKNADGFEVIEKSFVVGK